MTTQITPTNEVKKQRGAPRGEDRRVVSNYVNAKLYDELHDISTATQISKSRLLDKSIELLIQHYNDNDGAIKYNKVQ